MATPAMKPELFTDPVVEQDRHGRPAVHRWELPVDADFLRSFLIDIFENHWDEIIFGPVIPGAAFEWSCPTAPDRIEVSGGYLTIGFNGPHFHLCIGGDAMSPVDAVHAALLEERRPGRASLFRSLDAQGAPNSWGFEMHNRAGAPMLSIYFPSPFFAAGDVLLEAPDWSRLTMWRGISWRYLGRAAEAFDESSAGFGWAVTA